MPEPKRLYQPPALRAAAPGSPGNVMVTQQYLREILDYNPATGQFIWRSHKRGRRESVGADNLGYCRIMIDRKRYLAHKLAWLYMHGEWPPEIDHINGNRSDNRISNLRLTNRSLNSANRQTVRNGLKGCWLDKRTRVKKWCASIMVNRKVRWLGYFKTEQEAHAAYSSAAREVFGEFARLN